MNRRVVKYFSWIGLFILPLLFSIVTYFVLNNLRIDISTASIVKTGYIQINGVSQSQVFINGELKGNSSQIISIPLNKNDNKYLVEVQSRDKRKWAKTVKVLENIASIYHPILYPENLEFSTFTETNTIFHSNNSDYIFHSKNMPNGKIYLYRIFPNTLLLNTDIKESLFADLTDLVSQEEEYNIIAGYTGNYVALIIPKKPIVLINNDKFKTLPNIVAEDKYKYYWSKNDNYFLIESSKEIISYTNQGTVPTILYRTISPNETIEIQYTSNDYLVFKSTIPERTKLYQLTYSGKLTEIDLPNFDNIKVNNLKSAYDFSEKTSQILLQTEKNIYLFNVNNHDFRKINLYEDEKVFLVDQKNQIIITYNSKANTQFRIYDQIKLESSSFKIENITDISKVKIASIFNNGHNLFINLENEIILIDSDGANKKVIPKKNVLETILKIYKNNLNIFILKLSSYEDPKGLNSMQIEICNITN